MFWIVIKIVLDKTHLLETYHKYAKTVMQVAKRPFSIFDDIHKLRPTHTLPQPYRRPILWGIVHISYETGVRNMG